MARQVFTLPDLGEGLTGAELVSWLVKVGDEIRVDQPVAEVETAKSLVEVPSPYAGTVAVLHGAAGDTIDVGKPLISVDAPGTAAEAYRTEERAGAKPPVTELPRAAGSGNVLIGYGTSGEGAAGRTRRPKAAVRTAGERRTPAAAPVRGSGQRAPLVISPLVRKLARDGGLRLEQIAGTGPDGLVLRRDVEAALAGRAPQAAGAPAMPDAAVPAAPAAGAAAPETDARTGLGIAARTPLRGVRRAIAEAMARSRSEIPEATVWVDVDATALLELRAGLKRRDPENTPGLLAFIARFVLAGLARYPELNSRIEDGGITRFDGVNLGFAVQADRGLLVPAVRNAHRCSARDLDAEIRRLTALARAGKAGPAELTGGTFTLNNYGVFGVDGSAAIINYPEAAILGVGRIMDRPWAVDGQLAVRKVTELVLVFDHRICDGGTAGGFLRYVADAIENPGSVLADL